MLGGKKIEALEKHVVALQEHNNSLDVEISVMRGEVAKLMEIMQRADKSYKNLEMRLTALENRVASFEAKK